MDWLYEQIFRGVGVIHDAPLMFGLMTLAIVMGAFFLNRWLFTERIDNARTRADTQEQQISFLHDRLNNITSGNAPIQNAIKQPSGDEEYKPIAVSDKQFMNERVLLDGHEYSHCRFTNVTFVYNGTTPLRFNYNEIIGKSLIRTDDKAVSNAWNFMYGLGVIKDDIASFTVHPLDKIEPIEIKHVDG